MYTVVIDKLTMIKHWENITCQKKDNLIYKEFDDLNDKPQTDKRLL